MSRAPNFPGPCGPSASALAGYCSRRVMRWLAMTIFIGGVLPPAHAQIAFEKHEGRLTITVDQKPFAVYVWNDPTTTRPYFMQVHAAGGEVQLTRHHPPAKDDIQDHATYHPGIWWGFGDVGGNDYWRMKARVVGGDFVDEPQGGPDWGRFSVRDKLLVNGGDEIFAEQLCRYTIMRRPMGLLLVCETTFQREQGDFWLGDQEEMGLGIRVASPMALVSQKGGRILSSERTSDLKQIRTQQSDWCDYSGPIAGKFGGLLVMNHPKNFRKPWWHAVETGLLVANPLGESELTGHGKKRQNVLVKQGEPFHLCYGVLIHLHAQQSDFSPRGAYSDFLSVLPTLDEPPGAKKTSEADLPQVPEGFRISVFASEPEVYKPSAMCFDARGRLFVGQGPQYPENYEDSPTDSVFLYLDRDHDGVADSVKLFAKGLNSIQGLAWKGNDLYIANSPELTLVRDLDGDDEADEYVMVYTDLGNREHALHGLNWAPDGKLYMSKGNSKGHNQPEKYGYVAPRAFRELWDVEHPPGAPDEYPPKVFTKDSYHKTYHHWDDDWGREGGVLRCDPLGKNLEIVSRGLRNPWDITFDAGFNWLGTDNDQSQGDRIVMPFFGAHFGWGHPYSSHWSGDKNLPTAPVSGPMFPGSGTGIVYYDHEHFPASYRQVFLINDWLDGTFVYQPTWDGALLQPAGGALRPFIRRGTGAMLYRPTDLEFGPDGSLYSCGWGGGYHYDRGREGSWIFRVTHIEAKPALAEPKRSRPIAEWSVTELLDDLRTSALPVWRTNAQDELVRRGDQVKDELMTLITNGGLNEAQQTWVIWALARMLPADGQIDQFLARLAIASPRGSLNARLQALRSLAHRVREHGQQALATAVRDAVDDPEPRVRFEAMQAIRQAKAQEFLDAMIDRLADEQDRLVFYAGWNAWRQLASPADRKRLLEDERPRVRLAALLSLQEDYQLTLDEALAIAGRETDSEVQTWAMTFAMNPRPPQKMPNTTARVELEQSLSGKDLVAKAEQAASNPVLRRLYLKLISRATFRGNDWQTIRTFYDTLKTDEERSLALVPLTNTIAARELVWEAFGGEEPLQRAAVDGWQRMLTLSAIASPSSEQMRKEQGLIQTDAHATHVEANGAQLAAWLLDRLKSVGPEDRRVSCAIEVIAAMKLPPNWIPPGDTDTLLAAILNHERDPLVRSRVLAIVGKLSPDGIPSTSPLRDAVAGLCRQPDPRLYLALVEVTKRLRMDVTMPKLEPAKRDDVLAHLANANVERGRRLFFESVGGLDCAACHRVEGRGNPFAPDLSGIGLRAKPEVIVESILTPSAVITEGYSQQQFITEDGLTITGVVLQESAGEVVVFKSDRTQQSIPAKSITEREKLKLSAMPDGFALFGAEQIADITAYLLTLKHRTPAVPAVGSATRSD